MSLSADDIALIDRYLRGELRPEEQASWRDRMRSSTFASEVATRKDMQVALTVAAETELKSYLQSVEVYEGAKVIRPRWTPLRVASLVAAVALLLLGSWWWIGRGTKASDFDSLVAAELAIPYPNTLHPVSIRGQADSSQVGRAFNAYEKKNYGEASQAFSAYLQEHTDPNVRFFLAMSQLEQADEAAATKNLVRVTEKSALFSTQANWYLGLLAIKKQAWGEARRYLQTVKQAGGFKLAEAEALLRQIPS